ncbi:uncharacterized protein LOC111303157 [Durio zibethinus]|uniref:Uncharacterized protein LOC111303157 n=1 Tax=Durio zibethinus TaxID=66656 RepID=A0A6P5ZQX6_DURZI|nr:uncharacterized protein LOC111303157 [Durio zibethinus]
MNYPRSWLNYLSGNQTSFQYAKMPENMSWVMIDFDFMCRRGLSKHYQGKSQSFTSLASVRSIEDLPKKVIPMYNRAKMKSCKSYGWGLDGHNKKKPYSPKATISKKAGSRGWLLSSLGN